MKPNVDREPGYYHDESGERFRQLFRDAEEQRTEEQHAVKIVIFWGVVIFVCCALVLAKMYSVGAIEGVK